MYNVDINKLGHNALEPHRRLPKFLAMLYVMLWPLVSIYAKFTEFRNKTLYEMAITAQVSSLEYHLNKIHGLPYAIANRTALIAAKSIIYIEDTSNLPFAWVDNDESFFVSNTTDAYVAGQSSYDLHNHYLVNVPNTLTYNATEMKAEIDRFNNVNRKFTLQNY